MQSGGAILHVSAGVDSVAQDLSLVGSLLVVVPGGLWLRWVIPVGRDCLRPGGEGVKTRVVGGRGHWLCPEPMWAGRSA